MNKTVSLQLSIALIFYSSCSTQDASLSKRGLIVIGYKQWDNLNIMFQKYGDTTVYFSLDSVDFVKQKSVFIASKNTDSLWHEIIKASNYIQLTASDSLKRRYLYNAQNGNLYEVIFRVKQIEFSQQGRHFYGGPNL